MELVIPPKGRFPQYGVIDEALIVSCIEKERKLVEETATRDDSIGIGVSWDPIELPKVTDLRLSFCHLARIDNLVPLDALRVLRLDNNNITTIENLGHLVNLEWLDLSFNKITEIAGLEELVKLRDLSLYANQLTAIGGLDALTNLQVLSIGNNNIASSDALITLRRMPSLTVVNCMGNPFAADGDYRATALTYLPRLLFLDYVEVTAAERAAAKDQQHLYSGLAEDDATREAAQKEAESQRARMDRLVAANLDVLSGVVEQIFQGDEDGGRLMVFPGVQDLNANLKDKLATIVAEGVDKGFESSAALRSEVDQIEAALQQTRTASDEVMRRHVASYAKRMKQFKARVKALDTGTDAEYAANVDELRKTASELVAANEERKEALYQEELDLAERCSKLIGEFELQYNDLCLRRNDLLGKIFRAVEKEITIYKDGVSAYIQGLVEKAAANAGDDALDVLDDDARGLLADRDTVLGAVSSSFDTQVSKLLAAEDAVRAVDKERSTAVVSDMTAKEATRNRERVCEIEALYKHDKETVESVIADLREEEEG